MLPSPAAPSNLNSNLTLSVSLSTSVRYVEIVPLSTVIEGALLRPLWA